MGVQTVGMTDGVEILAEWVERFRAVQAVVHQLHISAAVMHELDAEIVRRGREGGGFVLDSFLRPMYAAVQSVRVRTLVDDRPQSNSLVRMLHEMAKHPTVLSRERYTERAVESGDEHTIRRANGDFDRYAGEGLDHIPKARLRALRESAAAAGADVKAYADEHVAHQQWKGKASLTWDQLTEAIQRLSEIYTTLSIFVTGDSWGPKPYLQHGWHQVFQPGLFTSQEDENLLVEGLSALKDDGPPTDHEREWRIQELMRMLTAGNGDLT